MLHYVQNYVDACEVCQQRQFTDVPSTGYIQQIQKFSLLDCWSFDHGGPFHETKEGVKYLTIAVGNVSRYVIAKPVKSTGSAKTARVLPEDVILKFGLPRYLAFDRGSAYASKSFTKINKLMAIKQRFTTANHPQSNALAGRMIKYVAEILTPYINTDKTN